MAETMQFDLVSPERRLASMQVAQVQIPGADGDLTAMPDHAPLITTLRPGVLRVSGPQGDAAYVVLIGLAVEAVAKAPVDGRDAADKLVADLQALRAEVGV